MVVCRTFTGSREARQMLLHAAKLVNVPELVTASWAVLLLALRSDT